MDQLTPIYRIEFFLDAIVNNSANDLDPIYRVEVFLAKIAGRAVETPQPLSRMEMFLAKLCGESVELPQPQSRTEQYLAAICGEDVDIPPFPIYRIEYWLSEWAGGGSYITLVGDIVRFMASAAAPFRKLQIALEPIQDLHGYDSPWPAGGGKNKFNIDDIYGVPVNTSDAEIPLGARKDNDTLIWKMGLYLDAIFFKLEGVYLSAGTYTISADVLLPQKEGLTNNTISVRLRSSITQAITNTSNKTVPFGVKTRLSFNITIETSGIYDRLLIQPNGNVGAATELNCSVTKIQLELGSTATSYSPYSNICPISGRTSATIYHSGADTSDPTTYTIQLGDTVYGGTLDVVNGKLNVTMASVDMGSLSWNSNGSIPGGKQYAVSLADKKVGERNFISSCFHIMQQGESFQAIGGMIGRATTTTVVCNSTLTDRDEFIASVSGQQLVYELDTPITYQLSPQAINSLVGENNVWDDGTVTVEVKGEAIT